MMLSVSLPQTIFSSLTSNTASAPGTTTKKMPSDENEDKGRLACLVAVGVLKTEHLTSAGRQERKQERSRKCEHALIKAGDARRKGRVACRSDGSDHDHHRQFCSGNYETTQQKHENTNPTTQNTNTLPSSPSSPSPSPSSSSSLMKTPSAFRPPPCAHKVVPTFSPTFTFCKKNENCFFISFL